MCSTKNQDLLTGNIQLISHQLKYESAECNKSRCKSIMVLHLSKLMDLYPYFILSVMMMMAAILLIPEKNDNQYNLP